MSNTGINSILEAVSELDNEVLEKAFKPKRKKPVMLIAIAAATFSLLVGFVCVRYSGIRFDGNEPIITFDYYSQPQAHIPTAEELTALGAQINDSANGGITLTAGLSEISALFNVELLANPEYFDEGGEIYSVKDGKIGIDISGHDTAARITYALTDKETGKPILVQAQFFVSGNSKFGADYYVIDGKGEETFDHYETIALTDGSKAFAADRYSRLVSGYNSQAVFCCNGVGYKLNAKNTDINEMKPILEKLGIKD